MKEKMKFGLTVTDINNWTNENSQDLSVKELFGFETLTKGQIGIMDGYKTDAMTAKFMDSTVSLQAQACGIATSSGNTTISDRLGYTTSLMSYETFCAADLENTSLSLSQPKGKWNSDIPFLAQLVVSKASALGDLNEDNFWNYSSGNVAGIKTQCLANSGSCAKVVTANFNTLTGSTLFAKIKEMVTGLPKSQKLGDIIWYVSHSIADNIKFEYQVQAHQNVVSTEAMIETFGSESFKLPYFSNIVVIPVAGLEGGSSADYSFLTVAGNFNLLTDYKNDLSEIRTFYIDYQDLMALKMKFRFGTFVKYFGLVVYSKPS